MGRPKIAAEWSGSVATSCQIPSSVCFEDGLDSRQLTSLRRQPLLGLPRRPEIGIEIDALEHSLSAVNSSPKNSITREICTNAKLQ